MRRDITPHFKTGLKVKPRKRGISRATKRALLERSLGRCEAGFVLGCTGVGVHAHHKKRRAQLGSDEPENLFWVCMFCHDAIHRHPEAARELGLLAQKGGL